MDFFSDWFEGLLDLDENLELIDKSVEKSPRSDDGGFMSVRVAQDVCYDAGMEGQPTFIILDSGSDASLLPRNYIPDDNQNTGHRLKDCQGNFLGVSGTKKAEIVVKDVDNIDTIMRQECLVNDVTNCLLSLGGLFTKGWNINRTTEGSILLISPHSTLSVPIHYRGSSLAIDCHIRCISEEPAHDMQELETLSVRVLF